MVIGNPPWGQKEINILKEEEYYFKEKYPVSTIGILDLFRFFIEKSFNLIKDNGLFGLVLPDIILLKNYDSTRKLILDKLCISDISHWGMAFKKVNLDSCTIIGNIDNRTVKDNIINIFIHDKDKIISNRISQKVYNDNTGYKFNLYLTDDIINILNKFKNYNKFSDYFESHEGIHSGNIRKKLFIDECLNNYCKKLILGGDEVKRYNLTWNGKWVNYSPNIIDKKNKEYAGLGNSKYFENNKLVVRRTGDFILANVDNDNYYFSNNVFVCIPKFTDISLLYFLGILNSKFLTWYYRTIQPRKGKLFAELKINVLNSFPMPNINLDDKQDKEMHDKIVALVDSIIALNKKLAVEKNPNAVTMINRQINAVDKQIDALVYKLYNLSDEEVRIIEGD
nr:TaqI-like C-terminal specificity domain-containing protein [Brachyspira alvinipulli]